VVPPGHPPLSSRSSSSPDSVTLPGDDEEAEASVLASVGRGFTYLLYHITFLNGGIVEERLLDKL